MASLGTLAILGSALGAVGSVASGASQSAALKAQANAAERQANEEQAAAQRDAISRREEANLVLSRQQAVAAASGGSATDTTILNLIGNTAARGDYNVASSIYEGKARAANLYDQAAIDRQQARASMLSGIIGGGATLLQGISSYNRYRYDPNEEPSLAAAPLYRPYRSGYGLT